MGVECLSTEPSPPSPHLFILKTRSREDGLELRFLARGDFDHCPSRAGITGMYHSDRLLWCRELNPGRPAGYASALPFALHLQRGLYIRNPSFNPVASKTTGAIPCGANQAWSLRKAEYDKDPGSQWKPVATGGHSWSWFGQTALQRSIRSDKKAPPYM